MCLHVKWSIILSSLSNQVFYPVFAWSFYHLLWQKTMCQRFKPSCLCASQVFNLTSPPHACSVSIWPPRFQVPASLSILSPPHLAALHYNYFESFHFTVYHYFRLLIDVIATLSFYRPYNDHVARCGSQSIDKGAENRYGHIGSEASAAVLGMRALAQSHWCTAACWKGGGHTGAVVKDLGKREYLHLYIFLCLLHPGILELDCKIISFCIFYPGKVSIVNQTR